MKLVVGLGNPGREYQNTRHNIGFEVIAELARNMGCSSGQKKFSGELWEGQLAGERVLLLTPWTYMNLSGDSVQAAVRFYKLSMEDILVICDDMNLEAGRLRLRASGSAGGQNGLKDIIAKLGGEDFPRLRVGIGRPPGRMSATNHVLGKYSSEEQKTLPLTIADAVTAVELWVTKGIIDAMNQVNQNPKDSTAN
ncbi:aminoacyl-tRNA hydrolase [Calycomorphotria hydatis]|uniref:Peptidyl-tRNA hydrolase n=1 Tax=Calycomorphotria hydatis TaxID=2528027 RepID=A0A517TCY9_9PLAN|nr:aminoacyl-tRNA hydrolase [Calycomorphotria hydatis]QDT66232.1 Peptidyl-tRNA hydrolase [Calycomorphotria hydatis]